MRATRAAAVDMRGSWIFNVPAGNVQVDLAQSGSVLS
jgi:hypothetical protein